MALLIDPRKKENSENFNPNVINDTIDYKVPTGSKVFFWILVGITLGLFAIYLITCNNWFKRKQIEVNTFSSNIQIQLIKRRDTLVKLLDSTKSSVTFEKDLLTKVTELRNINRNAPIDSKTKAETEGKMNNVFGKMVATIENYPNLKSTDAIRDLMQSADYCEREIAANRRLYNSVVNEFNQKIYIFPSAYVASRRGYTNLPLIKGSDEQLEDVKLEIK